MKKTLFYLLLSALPFQGAAQKPEIRELKNILNEYFENYPTPGYRSYNGFQVDSIHIFNNKKHLDIFPNESFYSQPFTSAKVEQMKKEIQEILPDAYRKYGVSILSKHQRPIEERVPNILRKDDVDATRLWGDIQYAGSPWVTNQSKPYTVTRGLANRHLMVSPSHGRYYKFGEWHWQRPALFTTREDLFTQSFVYPFLIPMLENAGAIVYTTRERDIQTSEAIVDNDPTPSLLTQMQPEGAIRYDSRMGSYSEKAFKPQSWSTIPGDRLCPLTPAALDTLGPSQWAFALPDSIVNDQTNPFRLGTARQIAATTRQEEAASASWIPRLPRSGNYAVYVSYATLPNSIDDAHYTVYHKGGKTDFLVNQQMGGGTWVYLGNFDFDAGQSGDGCVRLSNVSRRQGVVTADAVRFGGGKGQTVRGHAGKSQLPRFLEATRYQAQWCGLPDSLFAIGDPHNDYIDDIRSRSNLLNYVGGGSPYMPGLKGLKVPFELALNVHSDAGFRRDNTLYGTMSICTTKRPDDSTVVYPSGISRMAAMDFSSQMLGNLSHDLTKLYKKQWIRRELWDRNYAESRSPQVPGVILEMMSHQNFEDLKLGHDPNFKFDFSRAIYKAILQYVNFQHGIGKIEVQPLPVQQFSALLNAQEASVTLSWRPSTDPLEESADACEYILYTRTAGGAFDNGRAIGKNTRVTVPVLPNLRYDFKITAVNGGGESFPSEILSVYHNPNAEKQILIVNGFERVSGPARIEKRDSVGFDFHTDMGVPYYYTTAHTGAQLDFNPEYAGQEGPGALGHSGTEWEGKIFAGNTFDYAVEHGKAIAACGRYSYSSISRKALQEQDFPLTRFDMMDYIAGLEKDADYNTRPYKVFPAAIQQTLAQYLKEGGNLFVSGAYIGSDMRSEEERQFTRNLLKYDYAGTALNDSTHFVTGLNLQIPIYRQPNSRHYAVQAPDAILPASQDAFCAFLYGGGQAAGIAYPGKDYRVLAIGFPFECISHPAVQAQAMEAIIRFLTAPL